MNMIRFRKHVIHICNRLIHMLFKSLFSFGFLFLSCNTSIELQLNHQYSFLNKISNVLVHLLQILKYFDGTFLSQKCY